MHRPSSATARAGRSPCALLIAAALLALPFLPAVAAPGEAAIGCQTTADLQRMARQADPDAAIVVYRGTEARAFVAAVVALFGAPPDLARTTAVGTYVNSDPEQPVLVRFFDGDGCDFYGAATNLETLHEIIAQMGAGI
jgi:hypothetical protein